MTKVYLGAMYGRGSLLVSPGKDEMDVDDFFELETDANRVTTRKFRLIEVKFKDGVAEVSEALGAWLLAQGMVSAEPQPIGQEAKRDITDMYPNDGRPVYPPPIPVGMPLSQEAREYMAAGPRVDVP